MTEFFDRVKKVSYSFDESTNSIYDSEGNIVPRGIAEPVYVGNDKDKMPILSGIYLIGEGVILTISGNRKKVVDINTIK